MPLSLITNNVQTLAESVKSVEVNPSLGSSEIYKSVIQDADLLDLACNSTVEVINAGVGAAVGSALPGIGTAIGAIAGIVTGTGLSVATCGNKETPQKTTGYNYADGYSHSDQSLQRCSSGYGVGC